MKANPDITVKVSNVGSTEETYTALNNAAQAGSGLPDVTLIEYLAIPQFVHSDTLMDLSKVYDTAKLKDTFTPGTWNSVNINGGLYAMKWIQQRLLYGSEARLEIRDTSEIENRIAQKVAEKVVKQIKENSKEQGAFTDSGDSTGMGKAAGKGSASAC